MQQLFKVLLCLLLIGTAHAAAEKSCKLLLYIVTDRGDWTSGTQRKPLLFTENLPKKMLNSIIDGIQDHKVVVGKIYNYLANLEFDPAKDTDFANLQEKKNAYARYLFYQVDTHAWIVLETALSNGDVVFLGYTGHFMKIKKDGSIFKGNLKKDYYLVTEEDLMSAREEEVLAVEQF